MDSSQPRGGRPRAAWPGIDGGCLDRGRVPDARPAGRAARRGRRVLVIPSYWKHFAFWASVAAAVCGVIAMAPDGMSVKKQILLGASVALPLIFLKSLHNETAAKVDSKPEESPPS